MSDFEKYKLGKMTKDKFIQSKEQTDREIEIIKDRIKLLSQEKETIQSDKLTRELMEKYVKAAICEGNEVKEIIWR